MGTLGKEIIYGVALFLGIIGGIIIIIGAFISVYHLANLFGAKTKQKISLDSIRQEMGRFIILGLEFFIGKDVLQSIFVPSWNEIGMLFSLIIMRSILSYFLNREIRPINQK